MKIARLLLGIALAWYVLFGVLLIFLERRMIYFPSTQDFESCADFSDAARVTYNGVRFYYKKESGEKAVVFYHGNAGSACDRAALRGVFEQAGYSYLFVEYPGYSGSGSPSKKNILQDVGVVRDFLRQEGYRTVAVVGESLGSGVAAYHASLGGVDKVALVTPYYELADMTGALGKAYPLRLMMRENYTTALWLQKSEMPVIIIFGIDDEIIPYASTKRLYDALRSSDKEFAGIEGGTHNTMYHFPETLERLSAFLMSERQGGAEHIETRMDQGGSALGVHVVPKEILEDSRCPEDVQCVQAGTVRLRTLLSSERGEATQIFVLGQPVTTEAAVVTLVRVEPSARSDITRALSDYRFYFEMKALPDKQ